MSVNAQPYPCDRGIPGNVQSRGWHDFHFTNGVIVCRYCGQKPAPATTQGGAT